MAIAVDLADAAAAMTERGPVRVVIDGPAWSGLDLAEHVVDELHARGRQALHIRATDFLRPASVRLERGRDDPDSFYDGWTDIDALRREVFEPLGPNGSRQVLPALWDPELDRATRSAYVAVGEGAVVVCSGWLLLGRGLPTELTVHVQLSPAARSRRVPAEAAARELPAFDRYDETVRPAEVADIVIRADDPRHPAVIDRRRQESR